MSKPNMFADDGDEIDLSGFQPAKGRDETAPSVDQMRQVSDKIGFPSRQARPSVGPAVEEAPAPHTPRTYRTGRTAQLNCRVKQAAWNRVYAIADQQGWRVGETVERALEALERELAKSRAP